MNNPRRSLIDGSECAAFTIQTVFSQKQHDESGSEHAHFCLSRFPCFTVDFYLMDNGKRFMYNESCAYRSRSLAFCMWTRLFSGEKDLLTVCRPQIKYRTAFRTLSLLSWKRYKRRHLGRLTGKHVVSSHNCREDGVKFNFYCVSSFSEYSNCARWP